MRSRFLTARRAACLGAVLVLAACGGGGASDPGPTTLSAPAQLGELIFADTALSASGRQSCATCHDPATGFAAADGRATPLGGPGMDLPGLRSTPSLMYASYTPAFRIEADGTAVGGFFRDGRVATLAEQATMPFLNGFEMANADAAELLARLSRRPYFNRFVAVFGTAAASDAQVALTAVGTALAAFETEDPRFQPFSSKFDAFLRGQAQLGAAEAAGYALFIDPTRGNCTACHVATGSPRPLFTDFTYDNVGVPRNWAIPANDDATTLPYVPANGVGLGAPEHRYYDLGLCGPLRADLATPTRCGQFKVPTLRNVALRQHYFHNGVFDRLEDVVSWYVTRDTDPTRWYRQADGVTPDIPYNDLPQRYVANVNVTEAPYHPDLAPTLTPAQVTQVVAFLCTLTDGYDPAHPDAYPMPKQCAAAAAAAQP